MEIDEVEEVVDVIVRTGTVQADIILPQTVNVTDKTYKTMTLPLGVVWDLGASSFDENTPGGYSVTGTLTLQNHVSNPENRTANVNVNVVSADIPVTSVTLNRSTLNLTAGGSVGTLIATVAPTDATDQNVIWSSGDSTVASVDGNGVVTPISAGTATITVTTVEGGKTAISIVIVEAASIPDTSVISVTLSLPTLDLIAGGVGETLIATINPSNATNQNVTWSSDNEAVASVDGNGVVTPNSAGTATITVTTADGGKVATSLVMVKNNTSGGGGSGGYYPNYTLTFNINEGSTVTSQTLGYNEKAVNPAVPSKEGYTFAGWYKEATFLNEWDFATDVVKENTVLYAKWTMNSTSDDSLALIPIQPPVIDQPEESMGLICTANFTDTATHWAQIEIDDIACREIIKGYPDGTFKPNNSITREHVALMFTRAFELEPIRSTIEFSDVPTHHKYYDAITQVYQAGIFDGAPNGEFNPDTHMTRAQMAKVLVLAFDLQPSETSTNGFRDVPVTHWAKDYIATLADNGIALGDNGNFKPDESITRAQFVAFMYRALKLY